MVATSSFYHEVCPLRPDVLAPSCCSSWPWTQPTNAKELVRRCSRKGWRFANTVYLETDLRGQTAWEVSSADWPMAQSLSAWWSGSYYSGYYLAVGKPSITTEKSDMKYDNVLGYLSALNIVEYYQSGYHLPGHPTGFGRYDYQYYANGPIGHWVDNEGFHSSGWTVEYDDPATFENQYLGWSVQPVNDVNLSDINTLLQTNGMVW